MTVKELKSKIHGWKKKKLAQINVPKNCKLRRMKAIFWEKNYDFCCKEYAVFPNVSFPSVSEIIKGVFSKYFAKFCGISLMDQEYNVVNKTWTFFFSFLSQKSPRTFLLN